MLDFLFALGQFLCVIGLLYGMIVSIANWEYSGSIERRYDAITGHEWSRETGDAKLELSVVPVQHEVLIETVPLVDAYRPQSPIGRT